MEYNAGTQSFKPKNAKKKNPKATVTLVLVGVIVVILLFFFAAFSPFVTVPTGHTGVVTMFGRVEETIYGEGFHVKNPLARVVTIDNRALKESTVLQAFSSDIQQVDVIATVNYSVKRDNARDLYQSVGLQYYKTIMQPRIQESVKSVFARYSAEKLVGARELLAGQVMEILVPEMEEYGISVLSISVEDLDFTDAFTDAVEAKQVAEQTKLKTEIEQAQQLVVAETDAQRRIIGANADAKEREILSEADANVKRIQADAAAYAVKVNAEAEAEANKLIAASLTEQLVNYKQVTQWDGAMPAVYGGSGTLPILDVMDVIE